jgi:hypothetical protein
MNRSKSGGPLPLTLIVTSTSGAAQDKAMLVHSKPVASRSARALLLASVAALVMSSFEAHAAPAAAQSSAPQQLAPAGDSDFGARKRMRARRGGNAAGLAMMGMMIGTVGAVIANQQRREAYERAYARPYYGGYPHGHSYGYYQQPRVYHQPQVYHQPRVYRNPAAINSWQNPYDDPRINAINQRAGTIVVGPPRIGF